MKPRLQRLQDVARAPDLESFHRQMLAMAEGAGFGLMSAMFVIEDPTGGGKHLWHEVANRPLAYRAVCGERSRVARCPVSHRMKTLHVPFAWDKSLFVTESATDLWEEQAAYGYRAGVSTSLHLPDHRHFCVGFDGEALPRGGHRLSRLMADLQLLAAHALEAAERLQLPLLHSLAIEKPSLSTRQREALRWTLDGKTAWEVGVILGISERTVVHHLVSAMRKLEAISKHQAALKALRLGLIA